MSLRKITPCDYSGVCPYEAHYYLTCEYWCGEDEPQDIPDDWDTEDEED